MAIVSRVGEADRHTPGGYSSNLTHFYMFHCLGLPISISANFGIREKGSQTNDYENKINDLDRQLNELREMNNQIQTSTYSQVVQNNKATTFHTITTINILTTITNRTLQRETSCRLIPNNKKNGEPGHSAQWGTKDNNHIQMTNDEVYNTNTSAVNNDTIEINVEEITEVFDYISTALRTREGFEKRL